MKSACALLACLILTAGPLSAQRKAAPRYRIAYATYVGGSGAEQLREVIPYPDGSVLVGGQTSSPDLPVTAGVVQPTYGGEPAGTGHPGLVGGDCFLMRLSADGRRVRACTYFGGSRQERNTYGMGLDSKGNVVINTMCRSRDLPTTEGAFQRKYGGGTADWMVAKISADLKRLIWCTYVGGRGDDNPRGGLALDAEDNVYVVGGTNSPDFPTTEGVFQRKPKGPRDAALVKLSADGSKLLLGTRLGGSDWDGLMGVVVDRHGNIHVTGHTRSADFPVTAGAPQKKHGGKSDAFFAGFPRDAGRLLYATYLGGPENEFAEHRHAVLPDGSVLLTGVTGSADFPTTAAAFQRKKKGRTDGFLTKLAPGGKAFAFSTLLGGAAGEFYLQPHVAPDGSIFFVGQSESRDFPVTADAPQRTFAGGRSDGAVAAVSADGSALRFATFLGGSGDDLIRSIAFGSDGALYLVGSTTSRDLPVTAGAAQRKRRGGSDAFVVKLVPTSR